MMLEQIQKRQEALQEMLQQSSKWKDAIQRCLVKAKSMTPRSTNGTTIGLKIPEDIRARLIAQAEARGATYSTIVRTSMLVGLEVLEDEASKDSKSAGARAEDSGGGEGLRESPAVEPIRGQEPAA